MSELIKSIFREYDIRGIFPDELNEDSIAKIAKSIAQKCYQESVAEVVIAETEDCLVHLFWNLSKSL